MMAPQTSPASPLSVVYRAPALTYFVLIIAASFAFDPLGYLKSWNEGRSALLAVVPLVLLELWRDSLLPLASPRRSAAAYLVVAASGVYYWLASFPSVTQSIANWGVSVGAVTPGEGLTSSQLAPYSWVHAVDYFVTGLFLLSLVLLMVGARPVSPLLYSFGLSSFLFLDAAAPFNTLGPLQGIVNATLPIVGYAANLFGVGNVQVTGNVMLLTNGQNSQTLTVFWPSAGVHGILIAILVAMGVAAKVRTGWLRGLAYVLLAAVGSYAIDLLRLVVLVEYALQHIADPQAFETFHSYIGDLIFLPWIALFLLWMVARERRRTKLSSPGQPRVPRPPSPATSAWPIALKRMMVREVR